MKNALPLLTACALGAMSLGAASAETKASLVPGDSKAPITISSDTFQADLNGKTGTWTGNVTLKKGKDVMRACQLTVNLNTGQAVLGSCGQAQGKAGGRVQGVFMPNSN